MLTRINACTNSITISKSQRQKRDFVDILGVQRLHALQVEWGKRQMFLQDKVTEPADIVCGRCKHFIYFTDLFFWLTHG